MKEILKALREQKNIRFDVYKKGTSLAFWIMLEKCEILIINNKLDLEGKMMIDEKTADQEQDNKTYKEADDGLELLLEIIKGGDVNECL